MTVTPKLTKLEVLRRMVLAVLKRGVASAEKNWPVTAFRTILVLEGGGTMCTPFMHAVAGHVCILTGQTGLV